MVATMKNVAALGNTADRSPPTRASFVPSNRAQSLPLRIAVFLVGLSDELDWVKSWPVPEWSVHVATGSPSLSPDSSSGRNHNFSPAMSDGANGGGGGAT